jgi:hypothetical protein
MIAAILEVYGAVSFFGTIAFLALAWRAAEDARYD